MRAGMLISTQCTSCGHARACAKPPAHAHQVAPGSWGAGLMYGPTRLWRRSGAHSGDYYTRGFSSGQRLRGGVGSRVTTLDATWGDHAARGIVGSGAPYLCARMTTRGGLVIRKGFWPPPQPAQEGGGRWPPGDQHAVKQNDDGEAAAPLPSAASRYCGVARSRALLRASLSLSAPYLRAIWKRLRSVEGRTPGVRAAAWSVAGRTRPRISRSSALRPGSAP